MNVLRIQKSVDMEIALIVMAPMIVNAYLGIADKKIKTEESYALVSL
jgi:hypothetical protein